jgi:hypothetical protein
MTLESNSESMPETDAAGHQNVFSRLIGVYFSPGETFKEIVRSPKVLSPVILLVVIGLLTCVFMTQKLDIESMYSAQLQTQVDQGRMTQEQLEQAERQLPLISKSVGIMLLIGSAISSLLIVLVIAGAFKLLSILIGAESQFKAVFLVTIYSMMAISLVSSVLFIIIVSFKDPGEITFQNLNSMVNSNLGAILTSLLGEDALPKFLMKLAGWIDLFAIWAIALLAIGYSAVSRKLKTATAAVWISSVYGIVAVIGSLIATIFS